MAEGQRKGGRKGGRPRADPARECAPEELLRRPIGLLEPDDDRAAHLDALVQGDALTRPITRWFDHHSVRQALAHTEDFSGWILAHACGGRTSRALAARLRERAPKVPILISLPAPDPAINAWCRALDVAYWPGQPDADDVEAMLESMERYEVAPLPHLAYVVRRAQAAGRCAQRSRLKLHEARFAAAELERAPVWDLTDGAGRTDRSADAVRSRALRKLEARSFDELRQNRRLAWRMFGDEGAAPWKT